MPATRRLNAEFFWECPTCRRAFTRPETAAQCHRPAEDDPLTMAAPLVRCSELPMFDGHFLALTGWLEAEQACHFSKPMQIYQSGCKFTKEDATRSATSLTRL
jgi:hypothetical protein